MSDVQSAPAPVPEKLPPPQQPSRHNSYHGGRGRGRGHRTGAVDSYHHGPRDDDINGRKKKPELQHYKPGAFNSSKRPDQDTEDYEGGKKFHEQHHHSGSRGGRGGSGRGRHHHPSSNRDDVFNDKSGHDEHHQRSGAGKRKNRRPEQPHYSVKKSDNAPESIPEDEPKDNMTKGSSKPPLGQGSKPQADDSKSDGGGSNTGTARRKNRKPSRSSVEKQTPVTTSFKEDQQGTSSVEDRVQHQEDHQGHGGHGQRQNGYTEQDKDRSKGYHYQHRDVHGRFSADRQRGSTRSHNESPSNSARNSSSRKSSPTPRDQAQKHHQGQYQYYQDEPAVKSSSDRGNYQVRRSPSVGSSSAQGNYHHRQQSPTRRGGPPQRYQRGGYSRTTDSSDWRHQRETVGDDFHYQSYQHQASLQYDRWGNDRHGGVRGAKTQPSVAIPPRFQRVQHQHEHEEEFNEPQPPAQQQQFHHRGSHRLSGAQVAERMPRRGSQRVQDENKIETSSQQPAETDKMEDDVNAICDWSEEVEEEERMMEAAHEQSEPASLPTERGGIIRLPASYQVHESGSWQSHGKDYQDSSPAWRGEQHHNSLPSRGVGQFGQGSRPQKTLYDPRKPSKPSFSVQHPVAERFPVADIRFSHPPPFRPQYPSVNPLSSNVRPPIPEPRMHPEAMDAILQANGMIRSLLTKSGPQALADQWDVEVAEWRRIALSAFRHLLEKELLFCVSQDIEFFIWQTCFYFLVEALKSLLPNEEIHQKIVMLIDEGIEFYELMLKTLDRAYGIGIDAYYDVLEPRSLDKKVCLVLISAQKCLLCLGDLARYKEQVQGTASYGNARQYYQKASNIDTRNGRPFNQLAILAYATKRKFEAVYYNMRCLSTSSPVKSSQETLTIIFEDVRRKWEDSEKKRVEEREAKRREHDKEKEEDQFKGTRLRKEIWIRPEGGRRLHRMTSAREAETNDDPELNELNTSDLNRRFNSSFLYLMGKLFTNINMDSFGPAAELLLKEFRILVSRVPLPLDSKRLVQIMALNMYIIDHTKMKGHDSDKYRSVAQNAALQLAFGMFGVLVERCNILLKSFDTDLELSEGSPKRIFLEVDLPTLLSAVKVWCDWIVGNDDIWYPVVCTDPFKKLAELATHLEKLKPYVRPTLQEFIKEEEYFKSPNISDYEMVKLEEDILLFGFNPWFRGRDWSLYRRYSPKSIPMALQQDARRLDAINFCVEFLEGHEPPILKWSSQDRAHVSIVENESSEFGSNGKSSTEEISRMLEEGLDILDESYSDDETDADKRKVTDVAATSGGPEQDDIRRLRLRKEELERLRKEDEQARQHRHKVFSEHISVILEIYPRIIVPDTNCFVDHLSDLGRLSSVGSYQLRVPVVVLNELDGLAKGTTRNVIYQNKYSSPEHAAMVAENAKRALTWLRDRPANTKCVTSRGTLLTSLAVTTEEDTEIDGRNNDDLILDVCHNLSTPKDINVEEHGDSHRIVRRDVVLLTEDRNLRLKGHMTDVPVSSMKDFIRWAFPPAK